MSRSTGGRIWFGRPSIITSTSRTDKKKKKVVPQGPVELAVVFENIATYRAYKPGSGPRLRPITLVPLRDTTAYIRDEFFIPPAFSQDGKKRLEYVVGWPDLPAARLVVDAERICDYVSPAAYEEWCAARAAERDEEEKRREEAENVLAVEEAEARERGMILRTGPVKDTETDTKDADAKGGKRKRTRKTRLVEEEPRVTPPPREQQEKKTKTGRPRKSEPSLSTPSKVRLDESREMDTEAELETEDPIEDEATAAAIFRQLNGDEEPSSAAEESYDSGERSSLPADSEPPTKKQRRVSPVPPLSRLMQGVETDSSRSTPFDSSRGATSSPALPPLPQPHAKSQASRLFDLPPEPQASASYTSTPPAVPRSTVHPPPRRSQLSVRDPPSSPQPASSKAQTPTPKSNSITTLAAPQLPLNGSSASRISTPRTSFTPLGISATPWSAANTTTTIYLPPLHPMKSVEPNASTLQSSSTPKTKPFAPAPSSSSSKKNPGQPPAARSTPSNQTNQQAQWDKDADELANDEEGVYEVLRLEGLQVRHVRSKPVRYFAVRWKGRWPPGQNPTWEPEDNIPRNMIKKYLLENPPSASKSGRSGSGGSGSRSVSGIGSGSGSGIGSGSGSGIGSGNMRGAMEKYLSPSWSQRKYSSVSEAFEGDADADTVYVGGIGGGGGVGDVDDEHAVEDEDADDNAGDDVLLVTDEADPPVQQTLSFDDRLRREF